MPSDAPDDSSDKPEEDPSSTPDHPASFPWLWLLILLLVVLTALRFLWVSPSFRARRAKSEDARFEVWAQEISDLLASENLTRRKNESPMAFARRVDQTALFDVPLSSVGECLSLIRYASVIPNEADTQLLRDTAAALKSGISRPARARCFFRRFFVPLSRRDWSKIL